MKIASLPLLLFTVISLIMIAEILILLWPPLLYALIPNSTTLISILDHTSTFTVSAPVTDADFRLPALGDGVNGAELPADQYIGANQAEYDSALAGEGDKSLMLLFVSLSVLVGVFLFFCFLCCRRRNLKPRTLRGRPKSVQVEAGLV